MSDAPAPILEGIGKSLPGVEAPSGETPLAAGDDMAAIGRRAAAPPSERRAACARPRRTIRPNGTSIQRDSCGAPP